MKAIIWSRNTCVYCDQAKKLLTASGIEYEERNISTEWTLDQLLEAVPDAKTVPQIFLDDKLIGGFTQLRKYLMTSS